MKKVQKTGRKEKGLGCLKWFLTDVKTIKGSWFPVWANRRKACTNWQSINKLSLCAGPRAVWPGSCLDSTECSAGNPAGPSGHENTGPQVSGPQSWGCWLAGWADHKVVYVWSRLGWGDHGSVCVHDWDEWTNRLWIVMLVGRVSGPQGCICMVMVGVRRPQVSVCSWLGWVDQKAVMFTGGLSGPKGYVWSLAGWVDCKLV